MSADLIDTIKGIIRRKQAAGQTTAWLSDANLAVLGKSPPRSTAVDSGNSRATEATKAVETAVDSRAAVDSGNSGVVWPAPPDVSSASWEELVAACRACACCGLCQRRHNIVIEDGCRQAALMFIGEGPGEEEDRQGVPFVGRAGQLLTRMIAAMGRTRAADAPPEQAVYIANIVKCRPPGNRNPEAFEAQACIGYLKHQIALVKPKAIVLLGGVPLLALMGLTGITRRRGKWLSYEGLPVMPTFHPAYLLRFERFPEQFVQNKRLVWQDLQAVMAVLKDGN